MRSIVRRRVAPMLAVVLGLAVLAGASPVAAASPAVTSPWTVIPGTLRTKDRPAAVTHAGKVWVFIRATDNQLWYTRRTSTGWTAWTKLASAFAIKDAPAVASHDGELIVFVRRGTDDHLLRRSWNGTVWTHKWSDMTDTDGTTRSGPAVAVTDPLVLFIRRPDNTIWFRSLSGSTWADWSEIPGAGRTDLAPAAVGTPAGARVVVSGEWDDALYTNLVSTGAFGGWELEDAVTTPATPGLAQVGSLTFQFTRASDDIVSARLYDGVRWGTPFTIPGGATTRSGPAATGTSKRAFVFIRNAQNRVAWSVLTNDGPG